MTSEADMIDDVGSEVTDQLEPAIPSHLRVPRTRPLSAPPGFVPQHASYSARFKPFVTGLVIAYYGVQHAQAGALDAERALARIKSALVEEDGPSYYDVGSYRDPHGFLNSVVAAYWTDRPAHDRWEVRLGDDWWYRTLDTGAQVGAFREIYRPSMGDTETTFSHPHPEGFANLAGAMSGKTDTHEYWGSARDRIPRAQTDALAPRGAPLRHARASGGDSSRRLVVVVPHDNLCLLRSGQDWSETEGSERKFYVEKVIPRLEAGMEELTTDGLRLGCYFNRYLRLAGAPGLAEQTYSLSAWHSLEKLETWVRSDTHLAIWGAGIQHYKRCGEGAKLRLYHEMAVLRAADQSFAYFNCHQQTGMLNAIANE
ncbi:conserved hypothetical protein [Mesorhizobium plurifarium]|uniref:Phenylacetaldoxime dehydratase n=1 Tax=Mesorhizobium plurifarium TaxID=69974 RepID=A0A090ET05_MESPL|nr:conserved hypothetical protein [Mesorhizobium plurifarium]